MIDSQAKFITISRNASSLYSVIADGQYRDTSLGRNTWKSLIGSEASLQRNCNQKGFNTVGREAGSSKARIGIIGNNEGNCGGCDSRIGFGTGGNYDDFNTCGNEARYWSDNGDKHIKAMGCILVQWQETKRRNLCLLNFFMCVSLSHFINQNKHPDSLSEIFSLFAPQTKLWNSAINCWSYTYEFNKMKMISGKFLVTYAVHSIGDCIIYLI